MQQKNYKNYLRTYRKYCIQLSTVFILWGYPLKENK